MTRIALIAGDGIGPEVLGQARRVLLAVSEVLGLQFTLTDLPYGADRYLAEGVTITDEEFRSLAEDHDAVLLGALGDPRVPGNEHAKDILLGMRFRLDLYVNYRPCTLLAAGHSPLRSVSDDVHIEIFRENTEGEYTGIGGSFKAGTTDEIALEENVATRKGVERIVRAAFEHARSRSRRRVTLVDKANVMRYVGGLWRRVFEKVGAEYDDVERDAMYVDAMAMDLVRNPQDYHVVVASNLFGDIVSDLAAEVTGGLGLAPSANLHPGRHALFEPVHGSAPDIAGKGRANPIGAVRCVSLLLAHLGHAEAARQVDDAVRESIREGATTPDLGGSMTTAEVGGWIAERTASSMNDR
jgi:3-isopropylmalate dehydrogenase